MGCVLAIVSFDIFYGFDYRKKNPLLSLAVVVVQQLVVYAVVVVHQHVIH
jgi:hypothetical protein